MTQAFLGGSRRHYRGDAPRGPGFARRLHSRTPPALIAATAVLGALVIVAGAVFWSAAREEAVARRRAWPARLEAVFRPPTEGLPNVLSALDDWRRSAKPGPELARELDGAVNAFNGLPRQVEALPRHQARPRYASAARLYLEFLRLERSAVDLPAGARDQVDLTARRVLVLADRVFDRARVAVEPAVFDQPAPGEGELRFPDDVPDWGAEGLVAGSSPASNRPLRQAHRAEQTEARWQEALRRADIPSDGELLAAIDARDPTTLGRLADAFVAAAGRLHSVPDPPNGRERAATVALGLLVRGEAARTAQAGMLDSARRLAAIGSELR